MTRRRNLLSQSLLNVSRSARVEGKARYEGMRLSNFDSGWNFGEAQVAREQVADHGAALLFQRQTMA
jgi:hypothetical protein